MRIGTLLAMAGLVACAPEAEEPAEAVKTGAGLSVDYYGDTDVQGFHFYVERVACDKYDYFEWEHYSAYVDLVDGIFPGQIEFIEETLDPGSRHLGADFFVTLSPGCYDVYAVPLSHVDGEWSYYSEDCTAVHAEGVVVNPMETTDVVLVSQCKGDPIGALDTLVLLNHPPEFDLTIDEKFNYECEPVRACATITDPDDDPIAVYWDVDPDEHYIDIEEPRIIGFDDGHRIWEACANITTRLTGAYDVTVKVYDIAWDGYTAIHIEDIVQEDAVYGSANYPTSHAKLIFPIYTNWIEEPRCILWNYYDTYGDPIESYGYEVHDLSVIHRFDHTLYEDAYECTWTNAQQYYCDQTNDLDQDGDIDGDDAKIKGYLCDYDGYLIEPALYPDCYDYGVYHGGGH